jgi:hypothetical protein
VAYIRTPDRTEILRWGTRLEDLEKGPVAKDFPEGDMYELAYMKDITGAGFCWVLYSHDTAHGTHHTLVSENDPTLFLPVEKQNESLFHTYFFSQNVSRLATDVIWLKPEALPAMNDDVRHVLQAGVFGGTQMLLLPAGSGRGTITFDGTLTLGKRLPPTVLQEKSDDLLWLSSANGAEIAKQFDASLGKIDDGLATGLRGIAASWAESKALRDHPELWSLPLSAAIRKESGALVTFVAGSLPRVRDTETLKDVLLTEGAKGTVRRLELVENIRNDVIAEHDLAKEDVGDWTMLDVGGSPDLFFASKGTEFIIATDRSALKALLGTKPPLTSDENLLQFSMNVDDGFARLRETVPFLSTPLKQSFQRLFGLGVTRISLSAIPSSATPTFEWKLEYGDTELRTGN